VTGPLIQPNLHAALVHFPLALLLVGVLVELLTLVFWNLRKSTIRIAGRWMLVIGILAAVPTLTTGLFALHQTAEAASQPADAWEAVVSRSTWSPELWDNIREHVKWMTIGTLMLLLGTFIWISGTDSARRNMYLLGIVVLVAGGAMITYGGHAGGELVYQHGVGVKMISPQFADASVPPVAAGEESAQLEVGYSPLELHVFFAGAAIALIVASLGLSIRLSNVLWENRFAEEKAVAAGYRPAGRMGQSGNLLSIPVIYPGIFWVLSVLVLCMAIIMGLSTLGLWKPQDVWSYLQSKQSRDEIRPVVHIWLGVSILTLAILVGVLIKFSPRRRLLTGIASTLLAVLVVGQVWTGVLMLFDGTSSPHLRFSRARANVPLSVLPVLKFTPVAPPTTRPVESVVPVPATAHTVTAPLPGTMPTTPLP